MSDNVQTAMFEILKSIQASVAETNTRLERFQTEVDVRLERVEAALRKDRRNAAGMLVMMRATAGDFDERVSELEERMDRLDAAGD